MLQTNSNKSFGGLAPPSAPLLLPCPPLRPITSMPYEALFMIMMMGERRYRMMVDSSWAVICSSAWGEQLISQCCPLATA